MMNEQTKIITRILLISFLFALFLGVMQIWYWILWPEHPLVLQNPIQILGVQSFGANNTVVYKMDYCSKDYNSMQSQVNYSLLNHDGILHELPGMEMANLPVGCNSIKIAVPIPQVDPGSYILRIIRIYHINPLRTIVVELMSPSFFIQNKETDPGKPQEKK